jgi:8-amino-7-oxononanoate synthase
LRRGNHPEHEALEEEAAAFFGSEAALYFPTGFAAGAALSATLPRREDLILYDALMHASFRNGLDPARVAAFATPHNDVGAVEDAILGWRRAGGAGRVWIAAETLYSMDGDRAPLAELAAIAARHDAMLILDEAHATGVYGPGGRGLAAGLEGPGIVTLHTCGKAMGAAGALICLPRELRAFMVNRARSFIYSTAPSPLMAAVVRAALVLVEGADAARARLAARATRMAAAMAAIGVPPSGSQIQPVIAGTDRAAMTLAERLQALGHDVRAIRPPTVAEGTARLRISLTLNADEAETAAMLNDLAAAWAGASVA